MLAVVAAIVFGVAIFFKVNTIEIQGNTVYSADQIIEASQIQQVLPYSLCFASCA